MGNTTKTVTVEEATTEVVVGGTEGEVVPDTTEISRIIKAWTMTTIVAVPREAEMTISKMKEAGMDTGSGIEMGEETSETTEGEEEDHTAEEADTEEAEAEGRGVGNNEEIIVEDAATVVATRLSHLLDGTKTAYKPTVWNLHSAAYTKTCHVLTYINQHAAFI